MAGEDRFTLFGFDTPQQVRANIGRTISQNAMAVANAPRGRGRVALASMIGQSLPHLFFDTKEEKLAKTRSEAMQNAYDRSKSNPIDYYKNLAKTLNDAGDPQGAVAALERFRELQSAQAAASFAERELNVKEKRIDERTRMQLQKLDLQKETLDLKADLGRAEAEVQRLLRLSQVDVNSQKVKNMQAEIDQKETKLAQNAEKLRQADDKLDILRGREATRKFDAQTRRMKLKADETLARIKNKNLKGKAADKMFRDSMNSYERTTQKKDFFEFAKSLIEDDPELGKFISDVDPDQMAQLIRGEVLQAIGNARLSGNRDFDYNQAVEQAIIDAAAKYTTSEDLSVIGNRPTMNVPRPQDVTDEDLINQYLQ